MKRKMNTGGDRIGRTVSMGELMDLPGVIPTTPANQRVGNCRERDDEGLTSAGSAIDWLLGSTVVWRRRCSRRRVY